MAKEIEQGGGGPSNSGEQGVPGGGSGKVTDTGIHYTDYSKSKPAEHNSWDETNGEVSNEHSTRVKSDDDTDHASDDTDTDDEDD